MAKEQSCVVNFKSWKRQFWILLVKRNDTRCDWYGNYPNSIITQHKHAQKHYTVSHKYMCMLLNIIKNKQTFPKYKYFLYDKHWDTQDFSDKCSYSVSSPFDPRSKSTVSCRTLKHLDHPRSSYEEPTGHILAPMSYLIFGLKCNLVSIFVTFLPLQVLIVPVCINGTILPN